MNLPVRFGLRSPPVPASLTSVVLTLLRLASEGDGVVGRELELKKNEMTERFRESCVSVVCVVARDDERESGSAATVTGVGGGARPRRATPGVAATNLKSVV